MTDIFAIRPPRGQVVHLWANGYRGPGPKTRPRPDVTALCGVSIGPHSPPPAPTPPVPLADALKWILATPAVDDPRPPWRWCAPCLGHAIAIGDLDTVVLELIADPDRVTLS